jgi:hypothetical protein
LPCNGWTESTEIGNSIDNQLIIAVYPDFKLILPKIFTQNMQHVYLKQISTVSHKNFLCIFGFFKKSILFIETFILAIVFDKVVVKSGDFNNLTRNLKKKKLETSVWLLVSS